MSWLARARNLWRRDRLENDIRDELQSHVEMRSSDNIALGMTPQDARADASRRFGNTTLLREKTRDSDLLGWMEAVVRDIRFGIRLLLKSPSFAGIALLSLALGIGANTAIFSLMNAVILRTLPVDKPVELEKFDSYYSNPMYRELQARNEAFSGLLAREVTPVTLVTSVQTERGVAEIVSGNYFSVLGVQPALGHFFSDEDDRTPSSSAVTVISDRFWRQRFSADSAIVGKTIRIDDYPFTIIGVGPQGFEGVQLGSSPNLWVPIMMQPQVFSSGYPVLDNTGDAWLQLIGRRKPGLSEAAARAAINVTIKQIASEGRHKLYRNNIDRAVIHLRPGAAGFSLLQETYETPLFLLMAVVAAVLLISCVNIANLLLSRSAARKREIAVRLALGAGRWRLVRQFLTESILLSLLGGALGFALSLWGVQLLLRFLPAGTDVGGSYIPLSLDAHADLRVLGFALAISIGTGLCFGLVPAIQSTRPDVSSTLKDEGAALNAGPRRFQVRKALVASQVALSLLLLVGAGLFLRSLRNAVSVDLGLTTDNVLMASINPQLSGYSSAQDTNFLRQLGPRLENTPGIRGVGFSELPLLSGFADGGGFLVNGQPKPLDYKEFGVSMSRISGDFFKVTGGILMRGRNFGPQDTALSPPVIIINQMAADHFFPGVEPIGKKVSLRGTKNVEVIGVVSNTKLASVKEETQRVVYVSLQQSNQYIGDSGDRTIYLQTAGDPRQFISVLRREVQTLDNNIPLYGVKTFADQKSDSLTQERLIATLSGFFGALALLLASIGLYGVMAYNVNQRTREIGIRMSLGATTSSVLWMILRDCLWMVAAGIGAGLPLSFWLSKFVASQLFGVSSGDPMTIVLATTLLACVAALAGFIPARRASRVDPIIALRYE
jgi:predicted permease